MAFNLLFQVRGKWKESVGVMRWKAKGNRLESPVLLRLGSDFSRLQRDSADCVAITEQSHSNSNEIAMDSNLNTRRKRGGGAGRMGEVGPPASGLSFFTVSYSRRWHSTRILLCEAADYRLQETKCEVER
ncbi:hypothetical protein [Castellaniella sp.]|uniref:hypothetical protein n=1 Tax=Castellaniella sp. TaxID=1955812 RepID=UPI002AFE8451|nr:hypothetical protein [Castellaniella sp.]